MATTRRSGLAIEARVVAGDALRVGFLSEHLAAVTSL